MSESLESLNLSGDEIKRISDAMKDEKFRKLFVEYAEEISNPENRHLYEEELSKLENERGMDITFVNPTPGYVLKTSLNGEQKAFINICQSDKIDKPEGKREKDSGKNGLMWYIPHSFAPPREDLDKSGQKCQVYDVVFHPDTYRMAETNQRFKKLVEDTALDGIEKQFTVKLDRKNLKRPNMTFKGTPTATVIRTKNGAPNSENEFLKNLPNPYETKATPQKVSKIVEEKNKKNTVASATKVSGPTVPKYSLIHRSELDMQEFTNSQANKKSTRPKELVVTIHLPLLKSAASADLDIFEKRLVLESKEPAAYKLDIMLPYPVNDEEGSAKFDKTKHSLVVTLPVIPDKSEDQLISSNNETQVADVLNKPVENKSLIEVLPTPEPEKVMNTVSSDQNSLEPLSDIVETDAVKPVSIPHSSIIYQKPDFTFTQDQETITFVVNVKNISRDSVTNNFPSPNSLHLKFLSLGSGGFPMNYALYIQFAEDCTIAEEHCSVDVSTTALVLLILKSKESRRQWNCFKAGVDVNSLEDQLFLTESNLQADLDRLDQQAGHKSNNKRKTEVSVTEMSQKKLTIKLQKLSLKEEEEEDYDAPSSADIEIVHTTVPPKLHSILKQRTISESSDDHHISPTSDSPRSDEDIHKLQRSVSFNNRVDSTSFHINKCPQSVKTTLHNKRKKARRKENLKQARAERKRNNSTGSEYSSGEDQSDGLSQSDTPLINDDFEKIKEESEDATDEVSKLARAISKGFTESPPGKCICQENLESEVKKDDVAIDQPLDFRTSGNKKKRNKGKGKGKKPYQGISKCDTKSTTESEENSDNGVVEEKSGDNKHIEAANGITENGEMITQNGAEKKEGKLNGITLGSGSIKDGDLKRMAEESDSSVVRIVASGDGENEKADSDDDDDDDDQENATTLNTLTNNEHKTQCAFQFSNSVIFDLDND